MRTTIELTDSQRARLLDLAARRGLKGFSNLVQEALDRYLEEQASRKDQVATALAVLGTLRSDEAEALETSVRRARRSWR